MNREQMIFLSLKVLFMLKEESLFHCSLSIRLPIFALLGWLNSMFENSKNIWIKEAKYTDDCDLNSNGFCFIFCVAFSYEIKLELLWILCSKFSNNMSSINFDFLISFQIDFTSTLLTDISWETNIYSVIYSNVSKY